MASVGSKGLSVLDGAFDVPEVVDELNVIGNNAIFQFFDVPWLSCPSR